MGPEGGATGTAGSRPKALAFYLPQFHPIAENDEWWGKGFTEWTNVNRARPLFPGHYQPHVPGELGYYDLRVPEVREAQAELARSHGIAGFVYYHYWFHGKRLLERPFEEVLASGSPDFPFALCWANEEWTRNWDAQTGRVLMPQQFSDEDDRAHIRYLLKAFADDRYIKIDGRPLMLIYRPARLPDPKRTAEIWRTEAQKAGFPDLYLCWVESWGQPPGGPEALGLDATVGFMPSLGDQVFTAVEGVRGHRILDYETSALAMVHQQAPPWKRFPSVMVGWDNTARRPYGATIFTGVTPDAYARWLERTVASVADVRAEENYLFIVAWNEWAEGNHLEPDQHFGRAFLEATRAVLLDPVPAGDERDTSVYGTAGVDDQAGPAEGDYDYIYPYQHASAVANAAGMVRDLVFDRERTVVDLGAGSGIVSQALDTVGVPYLGLEIHPVAVELMRSKGIDARQCDITDLDAVQATLEDVEDVGAFMLLDVLEHLMQPQQLLSMLSSWSLKHGNPLLVVSVPNVAHFDLGLRLLTGRWSPTETGLLDSTHIRFFTEETLERMVARCGWEIVARENFSTLLSDQYDRELNDTLPVEMIGALRVLAESHNPHAAVQQFVWAMRPVPVADLPTTYLQAVGRTDGESEPEEDAAGGDDEHALRSYLMSVGLIATETSRRSIVYVAPGDSLPSWKHRVLGVAYRNPRTAAAFKKIYGWVR
jgi:2-polyprenyl-3-methyl-5-hydroxy-6-metoxy-1,4-benzoquinol methylase